MNIYPNAKGERVSGANYFQGAFSGVASGEIFRLCLPAKKWYSRSP